MDENIFIFLHTVKMELLFCQERCIVFHVSNKHDFLPARASEQGNVIGLVSVYNIYVYNFFFVIEQIMDLIYLKFVATDFSPKIISPNAGENTGDSS